MQLTTSLTFLLLSFIELSSSLVISPEFYNYDPYEFNHLQPNQPKSLKTIQKILQKSDIITDVLNPFIPSCYILPSYDSKRVNFGNTIKPAKTQDAPFLSIFCPGKREVRGGLTVILTDPDAPSRDDDSISEMCHWIASIPEVVIGGEGIGAEFNASDLVDVVPYKAPAPPEGTGKHRYVFVLLEGANANLEKPEERKHWGFEKPGSGIREWANKENLTVVGANFHYERFHEEEEESWERLFDNGWY